MTNGLADRDDADLARLAVGNPEAFGFLYDRYVVAVYRFCARRLGAAELAEDATSQIFTRALEGLPGFRGGSFRAWLFTIAGNVVANTARSRWRSVHPLDTAASIADTRPTPDEVIVAEEDSREIRMLLASLPTDQRRVIELRLAGLSGSEVAAVLGKSLPAVKMLQLRAMRRLRGTMATPEYTRDEDQ